MSTTGKYRAPALLKGLEILELLARAPQPMPTSDISAALGRSVSELFRMLQVLEETGYISRSGEGYRITNRLFSLGMAQPPVRDLLGQALPEMRALASATQQSCHLAVASGAEIAVVATVEAPGLLGFAVRMGYRRPLIQSASGHILLAFQSAAVRAEMLRETRAARLAFDAGALDAQLAAIRAAGYVTMASPMLTAITDVSAPVLADGAAVAALTMPFVTGAAARLPQDEARDVLLATTARLSAALDLAG
ncbi:IclR family transcriptional regulator [Sphingomonas morindae]|uniref:IclR family transcriptional regulator n=1 Tax=Sphingomonas morindae TaxID=1541170 RepID=A0ABY4XD53_9SPHN|nr:IclR family transcriptional regulator [Sphingomonas morindae]USI74832.1 IclR family transcriptional regulator [Sphingomonas morindae]